MFMGIWDVELTLLRMRRKGRAAMRQTLGESVNKVGQRRDISHRVGYACIILILLKIKASSVKQSK